MTPLRLCLAACVLFSIAEPGSQDRDPDSDPDTVELMKVASEQLLHVERALLEDRRDRADDHVRKLMSLGDAMRRVEPEREIGHRDEIEIWVAAIQSESRELLALPEDAGRARYDEHIAGIRRACASCHLQFRTGEDERGLFPARGNVLFGRVEVLDMDGEPRSDRSNVVTFIDQVPGDWPPPLRRPSVSQKDRVFDPPVLVVTKGTTVEFPNDDLVFHNVFSLSTVKPFDLGLYAAGSSKSVTFDQPGLVKVYCNIHPEMVAHVLVLANPFTCLTTPSGFFAITDIPDGSFTFRTWHEFGGDTMEEIEVEGGRATRVDLQLKETRKRLPHKDKHGRRYRGKYK